MKISRSRTFVFVLGLAGCGAHHSPVTEHAPVTGPAPSVVVSTAMGDAGPRVPPTRRVAVVDEIHRVTVPDPYRWLEDDASPEVRAWDQAQNDYARHYLDELPLRASLLARLNQVTHYETATIPTLIAGTYYAAARKAGDERYSVFVSQDPATLGKILLDANAWPADTSLMGYWPSFDGRNVLYGLVERGSGPMRLYLKNRKTDASSDLAIACPRTALPKWAPDGSGFYFSSSPVDASSESDRLARSEIRFHRLTGKAGDSELIRPATNSATMSEIVQIAGHWLIVIRQNASSTRRDIWFRDIKGKDKRWQTLVQGQDALYFIFFSRDTFYIGTNDAAPRYRVVKVDPRHPERDRWTEIVPERPDSTLDDIAIVGDRLILTRVKDAVSSVEILDMSGARIADVDLPTIGRAKNFTYAKSPDEAIFEFSSFTIPKQLYRVSLTTGKTTLEKPASVPVATNEYVVERELAESKDGTKVPLFIVRQKDLPRSGRAPTILYVYGGFGDSIVPAFDASLFPWLERGGVYALAAVRGGGENGDAWHRAGMLGGKQNSIDDFIAASQELARLGWTRPGYLAARGASNGALVVAAAITQAPELFRVALCNVPLTDMIRYPLFGSGRLWTDEYGSPEKADQFSWLLRYSPYHHVEKNVRYPAVLIQAAEGDDLVSTIHARKFAAALQAETTNGPALLSIAHGGHAGGGDFSAWLEATADVFSFALSQIEGT